MINKLFPIFNAFDAWMDSIFPLILRLFVWGTIVGILSIAIYAKMSPQKTIAGLKRQARDFRRKLMNPELEFRSFYLLALKNVKTSLRLLLFVIGPSLISAVPVLFMAAWIHTYHGYDAMQTVAKDLLIDKAALGNKFQVVMNDRIIKQNHKLSEIDAINYKVILIANGKQIYSGNPINPPIPVLYKHKWWNIIVENPGGYLSNDAPIDHVRLNIHRKILLTWMPGWAAGWESPFFISVFVTALFMKLKFKIQ